MSRDEAPSLPEQERTRFWRASALGDVEVLHARYIRQRFAPHVHSGYVFTVIEQGAQRFHHRGGEHLAAVGSMVLINPDEVHTGSRAHESGWRYRGFYPEVEAVTAVLDELYEGRRGRPAVIGTALPSFKVSVLQDAAVAAAFMQVHHLLESGAAALQLQSVWREALLLLFGRHARVPAPGEPGNEPRAVAWVKEMLRGTLDRPPSLETLAQAVGLSPFHLLRVFRRATGLPPHAWFRQLRLEQARGLLKTGLAPAAVAAQLGFADQSHLTRQFKQAFGVGPAQYRRAQGQGMAMGEDGIGAGATRARIGSGGGPGRG